MSEDVLQQVTEPFFTTKADTGGTGLGLSISYAIIKDHKGTISFKSEKEKGTTVTITLPVYNQKDLIE
jgi:signal transduction histidine kinase